MAQMCDKSEPKKCPNDEINGFTINLNEIQRDFKRLKVDESDKQSTIRSKVENQINSSCNYFSLKSSPYSPKLSPQERKQLMTGLRRQRPHSLSSIKVRHNSHNSSDVNKNRPKESTQESESVAKEETICSDFKELNVRPIDKDLYFNKHLKLESNEWRNSVADSREKKSTNSENNSISKVKTNTKIRKARLKEHKTCARQALCDPSLSPSHPTGDESVEELAAYFDDTLYLPRKMSFMAESIYS